MKIETKKTSIKRCPFCGSEVQVSNGILRLPILMFKCMNKKCGAVVSFDNETANKDCIKALDFWNARAEKKMTNFERIKQMTAKELAEWLVAEEDKNCSDHVWCENRYCDDVDGDCVICLTEWLNEEEDQC